MSNVVWFVRSDSLGVDETLGRRLTQAFWNNLPEKLPEPVTFIFMNRAVFLALDDSPVLESMRLLAAGGSRIYSCGTCLDYYEVKGRLAVGEVGNMSLSQELLAAADKVVTV